MFTHQSSPRAYDATWEAKSTWLPEINRRVVQRKHLRAFHLLSRTRTSRSVAASSANHGTRDVASWWISQDVPDLRKELHGMYLYSSRKRSLPLSLESIPLGHKRTGFGWTFLSVHRGHPAKRSICENDTSLVRAILCMDPGNGEIEQIFGLTLPLVSRGCWFDPAHQRFFHTEVLLDSQSSPWSWKTDLDI